jgi:hypothetical protein
MLACPLKDKEIFDSSEYRTYWKIILEKLKGNVVMSKLGAVTNVLLSKAEKHVPYGGISWYYGMYVVTS